MITITKKYTDFPAGHRQHLHDGHCRFLHGHDFAFEFTFGCKELDEVGFVLDFGKLQEIKAFLAANFDHKFLVSESDPQFDQFSALHHQKLIEMVTMPATSAEGIARFVFIEVNGIVRTMTKDRAFLVSVTVFEDSKNSATYQP